jgi:predicted TIM-barrel fold metal-dependent hydrolase
VGRIDVHYHLSPPSWVRAVKDAGMLHPSALNWSPDAALREMDEADISLSLLSVSTPAVSFLPPDAAAKLARECNDHTAQLVQDFPRRFGIVGTLPMPHIEESLTEIDHLCDTLKAPAVCLMTNYDQKWLGHPAFDRVFAALNARGAVVHVHPSMTNPGVDAARAMGLPPPVVEYSTDTTRAIANLIFTGAAEKFPDVKMIFSHGGGTMPYLIERFTGIARSNPQYAAFTPERVLNALRHFFYDVAIVAHPAPLSALTALIPVSQIVYGSDSPYRSPGQTNEGVSSFFDAGALKAITRDNALRIMPSLQTVLA